MLASGCKISRAAFLGAMGAAATPAAKQPSIFRRDNLLAWCIVPFDAKQRGPEERAAMLASMRFKKFVYDWRAKDIPDFDREVDALNKHGVHLQGFWTPHPASLTAPNQLAPIYDLLRRRKLRTELWLSIGEDAPFKALTHAGKVDAVAAIVTKVATEAQALGCKVGLYNHGGWYGEPENQMEVLKQVKLPNTGLVYNFHHGHDHIARFPQLLQQMLPYLFAVNINGMKEGTKILPLGSGTHELDMLRTLQQSGYRGPIGILGHRAELDAAESLSWNLKGLLTLLSRLGDRDAVRTYLQPASKG